MDDKETNKQFIELDELEKQNGLLKAKVQELEFKLAQFDKQKIFHNIFILIIGVVVGALLIPIESIFVSFTSPEPIIMLDSATPSNGSSNIGLHQTLSWDGYIPEQGLIPLMLRLANQKSGLEIVYNIEYGNRPDNLSNKRVIIEDNNMHRTDVVIPLEQNKKYYWRVTAINSINNKKILGPIWKFETKRGPTINLTKIIKTREIPLHEENSSGSIDIVSGTDGIADAINLSYYLHPNSGWVHISNPIFENELNGTRGVGFSYIGGGNPNTLELKLAYRNEDKKKDTTFVYKWPGKTCTDRWTNITVLYNQSPYNYDGGIWDNYNNFNCPKDYDISKLGSVDFAVSCNNPNSKGGSGWVIIDNINGILE